MCLPVRACPLACAPRRMAGGVCGSIIFSDYLVFPSQDYVPSQVHLSAKVDNTYVTYVKSDCQTSYYVRYVTPM
jgi:hypothetical protein